MHLRAEGRCSEEGHIQDVCPEKWRLNEFPGESPFCYLNENGARAIGSDVASNGIDEPGWMRSCEGVLSSGVVGKSGMCACRPRIYGGIERPWRDVESWPWNMEGVNVYGNRVRVTTVVFSDGSVMNFLASDALLQLHAAVPYLWW